MFWRELGSSVMAKKVIWGINAGRGGVADTLFLTKNVVAIGWAELGDLSNLKNKGANAYHKTVTTHLYFAVERKKSNETKQNRI